MIVTLVDLAGVSDTTLNCNYRLAFRKLKKKLFCCLFSAVGKWKERKTMYGQLKLALMIFNFGLEITPHSLSKEYYNELKLRYEGI